MSIMTQSDGLPVPARYVAIATIALGVTMAVLDGAIVNIALPLIAHDLGVTPAESIWVVNAYQFIVLVSLLALSSLGDIYGYRRVYRTGLAIFGVASLACALSRTLPELAAARLLQGLGAACIMSVNTALVRFIYPKAQLGRGIAINASIVAVASAVGPTLAASILSIASWNWLFAVNVPLSLFAFFISTGLPRTPHGKHSFDVASAALNAAVFGLFIAGIDQIGHGAAHLYLPALEWGGAVVCGYVLVRRQLNRSAPLLPVDLLRIPLFSLSVAASVTAFMAQILPFLALPFYLQNELGRSEVETGLLMTPWPLALFVCAPIVGRLVERLPVALLGSAGLVALGGGLTSLTLMHNPGPVSIAIHMALCGAGFAFFQTPNNRTLISSAPPARTGGASGMLSTARLLGQTAGAALIALIFKMAAGGGTREALGAAAGFALLALVFSSLRFSQPAPNLSQ